MKSQEVVIYTRVSTDDQRDQGFSLQDQQARLEKYCQQNCYNIIAHYQDDHSAKTFNRPAFNQFLKDVKNKKISPSILLCVRMDRFSRNGFATLEMTKYLAGIGIQLKFIEGNYDLSIPENYLPYYINVILPEVDNMRRGLNTKRGLRQAQKEGRWTSKAPIGYTNDINTKMVIPNPETSPLIQWAFNTYAKGIYSANEVLGMLKQKGLLMSKQNFYNVLCNPFYAGKIKIPAWNEEPEIVVNGIHTPLISEQIFNTCKAIFEGKKKPYQGKTNNDELPLKGHLICPYCGKIMTGSGSKGNGGIYHYYHCQRKYGCHNAFKADEANSSFIQYLKSLEVNKDVISLYELILQDVFKRADAEMENEKLALEREIANVDKKISSLNDKFLQDYIPPTDYKSMKNDLEERKSELIMKYTAITKINSEYSKYVSTSLPMLADISKYYVKSPTPIKSKIVGSIFPEKLIYFEKSYRTTKLNEVMSLILNTQKDFEIKKPYKNVRLSTLAPQTGLEPVTL